HGFLRADDQQHVLATPLIGALWQSGKDRRTGHGAILQDDGWKWPAAHRREDPYVKAERTRGPKRQVDQTILYVAIQHQLRADLPAFHVTRRRRHLADRV